MSEWYGCEEGLALLADASANVLHIVMRLMKQFIIVATKTTWIWYRGCSFGEFELS